MFLVVILFSVIVNLLHISRIFPTTAIGMTCLMMKSSVVISIPLLDESISDQEVQNQNHQMKGDKASRHPSSLSPGLLSRHTTQLKLFLTTLFNFVFISVFILEIGVGLS